VKKLEAVRFLEDDLRDPANVRAISQAVEATEEIDLIATDAFYRLFNDESEDDMRASHYRLRLLHIALNLLWAREFS
jgi:uncharacterized protein Yka (UPF0111/DUF47 family)